MRRLFVNLIPTALCLLLSACCHQVDNKLEYPRIKETSVVKHFINGVDQILKFTIYDTKGKAVYFLEAVFHPEDFEGREEREILDFDTYDFSGSLDCRLYPAYGPNCASLFFYEGATSDWQTDGRFLSDVLLAIADKPSSRSIVQECQVRGMFIKVKINNVVSCNRNPPEKIRALDFRVSFSNKKNQPVK